MDFLLFDIRQCIEEKIKEGFDNFIIYPFGDVGMRCKDILNIAYGIEEQYIIDNRLCRYNKKIIALADLRKLDISRSAVILASTNLFIYEDLKKSILEYVSINQIAELEYMKRKVKSVKYKTEIGKHSYGPICRNHELIKSIGAFCSFAYGVDVVTNHEMKYLTTHPMIYAGKNLQEKVIEYENYREEPWFFEGVNPKTLVKKIKRSIIGNDVWLGQNVIITNGSNIGNGVIAGAGAVITKDVPDYAIVMGVPAKIIKFRYSKEEIEALNEIKWWNWTDEEIKDRYDDFYLPIKDFIQKWKIS